MEKNAALIMEIGQRLYEERKRLKLTQREMADNAGVSPQWYGKVERGYCRPSIEMLLELHDKYEIDITSLITGKVAPKAELDRIVDDCPKNKRYHIETILRSAKCLYSVENID